MSTVSLFLHSTGTLPSLWDGVPEAVFAGTTRLAPAHVGYPPNPPLPRGEPCSVSEEVDHLLARLPPGTTGVHLYAHSYGGVVALHLARRLGSVFRSAFLYEPVLFGALTLDTHASPAAAAEVQAFAAHPWFLADEARGGTDAWLEVFIDYWNRPGSWARMPEAQKAFTRGVGWKMFLEVRGVFHERTPFEQWAFAEPLTLAVGTRSPAASQAMVQALARVNPHAHVATLEGAGHLGPLTHPAAVHALMLEHVRRRER